MKMSKAVLHCIGDYLLSKMRSHAADEQSVFCNTCGTQLPADVTQEPGDYCPKVQQKFLKR